MCFIPPHYNGRSDSLYHLQNALYRSRCLEICRNNLLACKFQRLEQIIRKRSHKRIPRLLWEPFAWWCTTARKYLLWNRSPKAKNFSLRRKLKCAVLLPMSKCFCDIQFSRCRKQQTLWISAVDHCGFSLPRSNQTTKKWRLKNKKIYRWIDLCLNATFLCFLRKLEQST